MSAVCTRQCYTPASFSHMNRSRTPRLRVQAVSTHHSNDFNRRHALLGSAAAAAGGILLPGSLAAIAAPVTVLPAGAAIPKVALGTGVDVSQVVKGCWQLSGGHRGDRATDRTNGSAALQDFSTFYSSGVTSFDAADHYGPAEVLIGKWLQQQQAQAPGFKREDVQILTKVCVFDSVGMATINGASMRQAVDERVRRLTTPPDVVQYYWGAYDIARYVDGAKYLADEQARGRFKLLGVTNFDVKRMTQITDAGVKLASNQLQYSLLDRRPENGMVEFCQSQGIALLPYGVLAGGLLTDRYLGKPASSVDLDTFSKRKYASVITVAGGWDWFQSLLTTLQTVAQKHNSTIANVAARWVLDRPGVVAVILGARNALHVADDVALTQLSLDQQDRDAIQAVLDKGVRPRGDCYEWERGLGSF